MSTRSRLAFVLLSSSVGAMAAIVVACSLTTSLTGYTNGPYEDTGSAAMESGAVTDAADALSPVGDGVANAPDASPDGSSYAATVLADNPILYYRLGETTTAGPAKDSSKSGRAATFKGGVTASVPGAIAGNPDTACRFNGTTSAVFVANGPTFAGTPPYSLEGWARPTNIMGNEGHVVAGTEKEPDDGYSIFFYQSSQPRWERETPMGTDGIVGAALTVGAWVHLVGTFDGTTQRLYANGSLVAMAVSTKTFPGTSNMPFSIGANSNADTNHFEGDLDEIAVYDHVLTPARISAHFSAGSGTR